MQDQEHRKFSSCNIQRHFFFSLKCFCNKNNVISKEAIEGETTKTPLQRMTPLDHQGFWHGFHHKPPRYKTTRMAVMWEARLTARKIASIFAARKYSSSIYQYASTTSIRRASTLQRWTPLECHGYNGSLMKCEPSDVDYIEGTTRRKTNPWHYGTKAHGLKRTDSLYSTHHMN